MGSDEPAFSASGERNPIPPKGSATEANLNKLRRDHKFRTQQPLTLKRLRESAPAALARQASLPEPYARKMLVAISWEFSGLEFQARNFHWSLS